MIQYINRINDSTLFKILNKYIHIKYFGIFQLLIQVNKLNLHKYLLIGKKLKKSKNQKKSFT